MGWARQLLKAAVIFGCLAACSMRTPYSTPGTLYVEFAGAGVPPSNVPRETTELRNGHVVGYRPVGFIVARDRPDRWLVDFDAPVCNGRDGYRTYRLAPNGVHVLCSKGDDIRIFDLAHPQTARVIVTDFAEDANQTSFAWLDNSRFIAVILDKSCPYAHLYDFFPTRVVTFDVTGRRLSKGPCAFGVVAGRHRIALLGERPNSALWRIRQLIADDPRYYNDGYDAFHHTWSVDNGKTWRDGVPLVFDGNDRLIYADAFGDDIKAEDGQTLFKNVFSVQWSR